MIEIELFAGDPLFINVEPRAIEQVMIGENRALNQTYHTRFCYLERTLIFAVFD